MPAEVLPLRAFHLAHQAKWTEFANYQIPLSYTGTLEEHRATRQAAGLFDVSHMGELLITGRDAAAFLDFLLPARLLEMPIGKALYTPACYEQGGTVDDLIAYRLGEERFLLCVNAMNTQKDFQWCLSKIGDLDCAVENVSATYALLALQGPRSLDILKMLMDKKRPFTAPPRFHFSETVLAGVPVVLSATGYTGELGWEIYVHPENAHHLARSLWEHGAPEGLLLCGLAARDSLRLEAGYPLYGHELSETISPLEAGLAWTLKLDKAKFIGQAALLEQKEAGLKRQVAFFILEGRRIARAGAPVFHQARKVGEVLSGTFSALLNAPIGSVLLETAALKEDLNVQLGGQVVSLKLKKPPLHL